MTWINDYIHGAQYDAITHPCPNPNGGIIAIITGMNDYVYPTQNHVSSAGIIMRNT